MFDFAIIFPDAPGMSFDCQTRRPSFSVERALLSVCPFPRAPQAFIPQFIVSDEAKPFRRSWLQLTARPVHRASSRAYDCFLLGFETFRDKAKVARRLTPQPAATLPLGGLHTLVMTPLG
jgi:hypothetical protein